MFFDPKSDDDPASPPNLRTGRPKLYF